MNFSCILPYIIVNTNKQMKIYDLAIIGSGPAGYSAGIYAGRYNLSNIIIGKLQGGTMTQAHVISNYPGYNEISGIELSSKFKEQAQINGSEFLLESVVNIEKRNGTFSIKTDSNKEVLCKTIVVATGTDRSKLKIPKEDEYLGKGLSYCATCDSMFFKNKVTGVIGGGSASVMSALMLSDIAKKVYVIYRGTELKAEPRLINELTKKSNVEIIFSTLVTSLEGENRLERVKLSKEYNGSSYIDIDGLFVEIGCEPNNLVAQRLGLETDKKGYIKVDNEQRTNVEGVWASGDCTTNSNYFHQIVCAVSEGAIASNSVYAYLKEKAN